MIGLSIIRQNAKKGKVFKRFLMSYLVILLIPLALFLFILSKTTNSMEKSAKDNNLVLLNQAQSVIDSRMKKIYNAITNISYNSGINNVINSDKAIDTNIDNYYMLSKDLSAFNQADEEVYIYSSALDILLSSHGCYTYLDKIYGSVLQYDDMNYAEFRKEILNGRFQNKLFEAKDCKVNSESDRYILYMQSLPLVADTSKSGNIIYFIKESSILKYMEGINISKDGFACIVTPDNKVITGVGNIVDNPLSLVRQDKKGYSEQIINGEKLLVTSVKSNYNNWVYIAAVPKKVVLSDANSIKLTICILLLVYMLFGILVSCAFAFKNFKPLKDIFVLIKKSLGENQSSYDEYELLTEYVETINSDNIRLSQSLDGYMPMIKSTLINRLIRGEFNTLDEINDFIGSKPDIVCHKLYCSAVIDIYSQLSSFDETDMNELTLRRVIIKEAIAQLIQYKFVFSYVDVTKIGILFYSDEVNDVKLLKQIRVFFEEMSNKISSKYKAGINVGIGNSCDHVLQASFSYLQANEALRIAYKTKKPIIFYDTHSDTEEGYYFPDNLSNSLVQAVHNGNIKQVKNTLKILDVENFERRNLMESCAKDLLLSIRLTISKIQGIGDLTLPDNMKNNHDIFYFYSKEILSVCNTSSNLIYNRNKTIHTDVLNFIDNNYKNSDLCLTMIAVKFELSEPYVSYLLKKSFGINFSTYLEKKRIDEAKSLLSKGGYPIQEVAKMVGYNSSHSFRRAFKKVTNINPSDVQNVPQIN